MSAFRTKSQTEAVLRIIGTSLRLSTLFRPGYSQAGTAMSLSVNLGDVWPRMRMLGVRVGALVLLFYGASFYTRDWRSLVSHAGQPVQGQVASRSKAVPRAVPDKPVVPPVPLEPATTGSLPMIAETVARPSAAETVPRPSVLAPPRLQAQAVSSDIRLHAAPQPAAPRLHVQHKRDKRTQVAAVPAVKAPSVADPTPSRLEAPIQFSLAERGN